MTDETLLRQFLTLKLTPNFGVNKLNQILTRYSLTQFFQLPAAKLIELKFKPEQISALSQPNQRLIDLMLQWQSTPKQHIIHYQDPQYPKQLKQIASAPLLLFVKGNAQLLNSPQLGIVGSRNLTITGQNNAFDFAKKLAELGITITSGLAIGVDGFSHKGALSVEGGNTIAVLGTGLNQLYPKRHKNLAQQITEQGALVSEFLLDQSAKPENFPRRNRIISGLSYGTLVVEAAIKSGSLISARYALEQNREVFAIPGAITNPMSRGCHHLIKQGAILVENIHDIINELAPFQQHILNQQQALQSSQQQVDKNTTAAPRNNTENSPHNSLIDHIGYDATSVDCIAERSLLPVNDLLAQLLDMELAGEISSVPGGYLRN